MKANSNLKVILAAVLVVLAGVTIAYAAMQANLSITTNRITQSALSWNVGFQGSSATATVGGTSSTGRSCGTATITSTSVTVAATTLSKPDDSCTYELTIKNSGTIPATLASITPTAPTSITCSPISGASMVCGNITYKLTTDSTGNNLLTKGGTLGANDTLKVYLVVKFTGSTVGSAVTHSGGKFALVYNQS